MNIIDYYKEVSVKCTDISNSSLSDDNLSLISESHSLLFDFNLWLEILENNPETEILKMAIREYQMALNCNLLGIYNLAFVGLRFFLERTLIAIMFSARELDLRLWQRGERDTYWQEIINKENGLFSSLYSRAFFEGLKDELPHYRAMTEKVYRECSEFVHGNFDANKKIPEALEFDKNMLDEWHRKAATIKSIVFFAFCLRYLHKLNGDQLRHIESPVLAELNHIAQIRQVFENSK